jgi:hypothetical protein
MRSPPAGLLLLAATSAAGLASLAAGQDFAAGICLTLILVASLALLWLRGRKAQPSEDRRRRRAW